MKRIISILIMAALVFSMSGFTFAYAEEETEGFNEYIYHLRNIGILEGDENGEIQEDAIMTRAEFCALMTKVTGAYGTVMGLENNLFTDVPNNYWGKDYIIYCANMGMISGVGDYMFLPEEPIETVQAIKIITELLGYGYMANVNGGYPTGYLYQAKKLGLTDGVDLSEEEITMKNIARLVFNSLDIDLSLKTGIEGEQVSMEVVDGKNILTEYLSMDVTEGVLDGCYDYVLTGTNTLDKDEITVDRTIYKYSGNPLDYMGQTVTIFYYIDKESNSAHEVKSILPISKENEVVTIDTSDIVSAANNVITYNISEDKEEDIKFSSSIKYVYNYELLLSYDIKKLPDIKSGKIELIDNDNDNSYDIMKIYEYETFVVESASDNYISGKLNGHSIDLTDEDKNIIISDTEGNTVQPKKLKENNILFVIENGNTIDITVCTEMITGVIDSLGGDELISGGKTYKISEEYDVSANYIGSMADLYLDPSGKVAFVVEGLSSDLNTGYLIALQKPASENKDGYIKILESNGLVTSFTLNERVNIDGVPTDVYEKFDSIFAYLADETGEALKNQIIRYKLNEEGKLNTIEASVTKVGDNEDGFVMPFGNYKNGSELLYYGSSFDGVVFPSTQTLFFLVPSASSLAEADYDDYGVIASADLPNDRRFNLDAYYFSKDHQNADVVVLYDAMSIMANIDNSFDKQICVYLGKSLSVNEDGESVYLIKYFDGKETLKAPLSNEFTAFNSLVKGDIIRFSTNGKGEIASGEAIYRVSTGVLTTKGSSYTASIRIAGGYVASIRNNMFRVETAPGASEGSDLLALTGYPTTANAYIVVELDNGNVYCRTGSANDLSVGDFVITQQRSGNVRTIVIFK